MAVRGKAPVCSCNVATLLVGKAILSVGLFIVVAGLGAQLAVGLTGQNSLQTYAMVLPLYFVGMVVGALGKVLCRESSRSCSAHGYCIKK